MLSPPHRLIQSVIGLLVALWLPPPAHADEIWTLVAKESHFGRGVNTLVMKRRNASTFDANAKTPPEGDRKFLLISGGSIYLAVDEQSASPAGATIGSTLMRWPHMKLIKIGDHMFRDYCFRCFRYRDGLREDQITLKFSATTMDPRVVFTDTVVVNTE